MIQHSISYVLCAGLGAPSLHQPLPPGYPPTLPGSIPQAYQFARDPQTGQLVVIPTEHLPHYGRLSVFLGLVKCLDISTVVKRNYRHKRLSRTVRSV